MFSRETYEKRRADLCAELDHGLVLLPGNGESPMNYADNAYPFRQDSTFLYYLGLDRPDLAGVIDVDTGEATLFGDELTVEDIVWVGQQQTLAQAAKLVGIDRTRPRGDLDGIVSAAQRNGRPVLFIPPYRAAITLLLARLLEIAPEAVADRASRELVQAVVVQRSRKGPEEVGEIESAVTVSAAMHAAALTMVAPGVGEAAIAAEVERVARAAGGRLAFRVIATVNGQTLHNHVQRGTLSDGDLFLLDCGAETARGYAGDLTSTFPVNRRFSDRQKDVYGIVLSASDAAVATAAPGVPNRTVHLAAARVIFDGLKELGIGRGDTEDAVASGAHALVFPHGIGHMMGLDVHDMENLGEDLVGYGEEPRSTQFGLRSLRLARPLEPGFVVTIEPGIYFIPELIDDWQARSHCAEFIDYEALARWRDLGGIRYEDDYLVTGDGVRRLGPARPRTVEEVEAA